MLNKAERFRVLKLYRICCNVGLLPFEVDLTSWELKKTSKIKRFICFISFSSFFLHGLYKIGSLAHSYFFNPNVQPHQLVIHAVVAMVSALAIFWYNKVYISDPALYAKCFNITLLGNVGGLVDEEDDVDKPWTERLREYTLQDVMASNMTCMGGLMIPFVLAAYIYDPTLRLLLYNALPTELQTWFSFGLCLVEEARFLSLLILIVIPAGQLQVIMYDLVDMQHRVLIRAIQNGGQRSIVVYRFLRRLQLYVTMLNSLNSYLTYIVKLTAISICTLSGYAAVAHFQEHPVFGIMYYATLLEATLMFTIVYDKAFKIPQRFQETAAYVLLHMRGKRRDIFSRQIRSIPRIGIKVGNFHTMERVSTLVFMDFVVRNIVNLLVAYG